MRTISLLPALVASLILATAPTGRADAAPIVLTNYNHTPIWGTYDSSLTAKYGGLLAGTLNGTSLADLYCVEAFTPIYVGTIYETTISYDGFVRGNLITDAGRVSWLMTNIEPTVGSDVHKQAGLQALIWNLVSPPSHSFVLDRTGYNNSSVVSWYDAYAAASTGMIANLANVEWITPYIVGNTSNPVQGLLARNPNPPLEITELSNPVPEPATLSLFVLGLAGIGLWRRRTAGRTRH